MNKPATLSTLALFMGCIGCASGVPTTAKLWEKPDAPMLRRQALIDHVKCEIRNAYSTIRDEDARLPDASGRRLLWLDDWGAAVSLKLVVTEHFGLAPALTFTTPMNNVIRMFSSGGPVTSAQSSAFALSASRTSDVTRTETVAFFLPFSDLVKEVGDRPPVTDAYKTNRCDLSKDMLIDGDLKIYDFMENNLFPARHSGILERTARLEDKDDVKDAAGKGKVASPFTAFTYELQFIVATGGGFNPTWKLVDITANPTGPLLAASRGRTNDLILTMGPVVKNGPSQTAINEQLAALIGRSVADSLRAAQP